MIYQGNTHAPATHRARCRLIIDFNHTGHHFEYLVHLVRFALNHGLNQKCIFAVHQKFENQDEYQNSLKPLLQGQTNCQVIFLKDIPTKAGILKEGKAQFQISEKIAEEHHCDEIFFMYLNRYQFELSKKRSRFRYSGILFAPVSRSTDKFSLNMVKRWLLLYRMAKNRSVKNIFLLNDPESCIRLNRRLCAKTSHKFVHLPDPVTHIAASSTPPVLEHSRKMRVLVFGSISRRKGVFNLLTSMRFLPPEQILETHLLFVGKVSKEDQVQFQEAIAATQKALPDLKIELIDEFIPYDAIPHYVKWSRILYMAYLLNEASSGIPGHASLYQKPVLGSDQGLIGNLVESYTLGLTCNPHSPESIAQALEKLTDDSFYENLIHKARFTAYSAERSPDNFAKTILEQ